MKIRREHGRIWFGDDPSERWSVTDYDKPQLHEALQQLTADKNFAPRDVVCELLYLVIDCPTTKMAQEKLALLRRALREVPSPYPEET